MQGYCAAVRSALTDDGSPPLEAAGLRLHDRLEAIEASLGRIEQKKLWGERRGLRHHRCADIDGGAP